jgi:hypothetical protein
VTDSDGIVASETVALGVVLPSLSAVKVSPRKVSLIGRRVHGSCKPLTARDRSDRPCARKLKLRVSFVLNGAGSVIARLDPVLSGRRVNGRCVKQTKANRHKPRCTFLGQARDWDTTTLAAPGKGTITIQRSARGLPPGTYEVVATPIAGGQNGASQSVKVIITG